MEDKSISINYHVYQQEGHYTQKRHVSSYPCRCTAEEVCDYLKRTYGVYTTIEQNLKEV